jgi:N4-gp56 family major capsid protein
MKLFKKLSFLLSILSDDRGWTTEMAVTGISEIDSAIPEHWAAGVIHDGNRESFWGALSGPEGSRMPVITKTGPLKQNGDLIHFQTVAQLMGSGVTGESVLKGNEETLSIGTFTVTADVVRHAVAVSKKSTFQANFDEVKTAGQLLKEWMGRKMDADAFAEMLNYSGEVIYANSKTSDGTLNSTDGDHFGINEIELIRMALLRKGALPLKVVKQNGRSVPVYGIVYGEVEDYRLNTNTTFVQSVRDALERFRQGGNHPLFQGAIGMYRNCILYPYYSLLQIPQGTPLRPETIVYATIVTAGTTLSVGGASASSGATPDYTQFFASSGSLQVEDEIISYTSKTVNTFAGLTRGVSGTTAAQHANNKLVTQRNVASIIGFGAEALFRALPEDATPIGEKDDYGAQIGLGIEAYYGQKAKKDARLSRQTNLVVCKVYSENPSTI